MTQSNSQARLDMLATLTGPRQDYELQVQDVAGLSQKVFVNAPLTLRDLYVSTLSDASAPTPPMALAASDKARVPPLSRPTAALPPPLACAA